MTDRIPRLAQPRLWTGLALAGAALGATSAAAQADGSSLFAAGGPERLWLAQTEGGEGGEAGKVVTDDQGNTLSIVARLGLVEGALRAAEALIEAGDAGAASDHVNNLEADLFGALEADLKTVGAPAFESEFDAAVASVLDGRSASAVKSATDAALAGIAKARATESGEHKEWFAALTMLTRKAGEEYGKGVKDGKVADAGEYQESWGNLQAAMTMAAELSNSTDSPVRTAAAAAVKALGEVSAAYPGIVPTGALTGDESLFAAAAARIELAAFRVK